MLRFLKLYRVRDWLVDKWQGRFKWGLGFVAMGASAVRFTNGAKKITLTIGQLSSAGTNHWPFNLFDFALITGPRACHHLSILGVTWGTIWCQDISKPNEEGQVELLGPDFRKHYLMFSCINHQNKSLEEIVYAK